MEGRYLFWRSSGRGLAAPVPNSKALTQHQEKKLEQSSRYAEGNVATGGNSSTKRRKACSCRCSLICFAALFTGGAAVLLKIIQLCLDPELSFSENLYMVLHIVNDVLMTPPYDAWTLEDLGAAREHMNRLLSTALMREEQPVSLKFTWRLRAQPLDQDFFSDRCSSPCPSAFSSASREDGGKAVACRGEDAAGTFPSTSVHTSHRGRRTRIHVHSFSCSRSTACSSDGVKNSFSSPPRTATGPPPLPKFCRTSRPTKNTRHLSSPSSVSSSSLPGRQEGFNPTKAASLPWAGYQLEGDSGRIATDIYSGDYGLLPPSDVDSIHFFHPGPHMQQQETTQQGEAGQQQEQESIAEQQPLDGMQREKKCRQQREDNIDSKNQIRQQTATEERQPRAAQQQQKEVQQRSFCSYFPCVSSVSISQLGPRLFSSWKRFFVRLLSPERQPKRRLLPPFPCVEGDIEENGAQGQNDDVRNFRHQVRDKERDGEQGQDGDIEEERAEEATRKGKMQKKEGKEEGEEGGVDRTGRDASKGDRRKKSAYNTERSDGKVPSFAEIRQQKTSLNIYSPHAGEVSKEQQRPPVFEVTLYWSAGSVDRGRSKEEGRRREKKEVKEVDKEPEDAGEKTAAQREGGRQSTTKEKEQEKEKTDTKEEVKKKVGSAWDGRETDRKEGLEETVQLVQSLKRNFLFCSAKEEELPPRERRRRVQVNAGRKDAERQGDDRQREQQRRKQGGGEEGGVSQEGTRCSSAQENTSNRKKGRTDEAGEKLVEGERNLQEQREDRREESDKSEKTGNFCKNPEEKDGIGRKDKCTALQLRDREAENHKKENSRCATRLTEQTEKCREELPGEQRNGVKRRRPPVKEVKKEDGEGGEREEAEKEEEEDGRAEEEGEIEECEVLAQAEETQKHSHEQEKVQNFFDEVKEATFEFIAPELQRELARRERWEMREAKRKKRERWFVRSTPNVCEKDEEQQDGKEETEKVLEQRRAATAAASGLCVSFRGKTMR